MKKYIGAICSAVASIFIFIFLALPTFVMKMSFGGMSEKDTMSGYKFMKEDANGFTSMKIYKVFAVLLIIVAVLLLISAVLLVLKNLNILKLGINLDLINRILLIVAFVVALVCLLSMFGVRADMKNQAIDSGATAKMFDKVYKGTGAGIGAWLNTIFTAIAGACGWVIPMVIKEK